MTTPSKLSDPDLAVLSRFDCVSEESLAALSRLRAGTRRKIIQSCATNPNFDDVDLYYLSMSELSGLPGEGKAAAAPAAAVVGGSADHRDAGESMINMEPPVAATATSSNGVPNGRGSNNRIKTVVAHTVAMKDHHQKKPVHSDSDALQRPPFNVMETLASLSRSIRPTMPTLFDHVCRKLQNLAIDPDQERATTMTMTANRNTKGRATTDDKGKDTGRQGPSTSSTTDERIESQRPITALKLTKLVALTESPPLAPPDQVCHNQETLSASDNEYVQTVIKKTKTRAQEDSSTTAKKSVIKRKTATEAPPTAPAPPKVCCNQETALAITDDECLTVKKGERAYDMKRAIDFEYQEESSSTTAKKRVIKPETATEAAPASPRVCCNKGTALAITDDELLTVKKAERAYVMKRTADFEYADEEDPCKPSTSSKKRATKKKNALENNVTQLPHPPPDLAAELRERIIALQGTDPILVIQKTLYSTDVNPVQCRLSLPLTKVNPEFLSPVETATLATRRGSEVPEIKVHLIEPSGHEREMSLKKWDMKKGSGTVNSTYNLVSGWKDVVRDNDLQAGMVMQLWSFQVGSQRWFVLVKVESDEGH